jgi:hypothetical protein
VSSGVRQRGFMRAVITMLRRDSFSYAFLISMCWWGMLC